jgi:hypothetical protein
MEDLVRTISSGNMVAWTSGVFGGLRSGSHSGWSSAAPILLLRDICCCYRHAPTRGIFVISG